MMNMITIMGRLTHAPELRYTQSGAKVTSFTLAVDRDYADKSTGERQTDFIPVVAWGASAEFVQRYFAKGQMAIVSGRLQVRDWTDSDGHRRRTTEVIQEHIYFGEPKRNAAPQSEGNAAERDLPAAPSQDFREVDDKEKLPF